MPDRPGQQEAYELWERFNPRTGNWLSDTKDILLRFLRDLFYFRAVGEYHFEPGDEGTDEANTELIISDAGSVNTSSVESRPAIIVSRGPFAYGNVSIDQFLKFDQATAKRTHTDLVTGSFVVNCIARKGLEAECVALIAAKGIRVHRRELQKAGFFLIGNQIQIGQETPAGALVSGDSDEDFVNVPITLPIYYQTSWTVEKSAALLAAIRATMLVAESDYVGVPLLPESVDEEGVPIEGAEGVIVQAWTVGTIAP